MKVDKADIRRLEKDKSEINEITNQFFDLFTNTDQNIPNIHNIKQLFLQKGILINNTLEEPTIYDLDSFIEPREKILTDGTLTNFIEKEISHITNIYGDLAQRISHYKKSGELNGVPFKGEGTKLMQFIKTNNRWFFSAVIWSDKQ